MTNISNWHWLIFKAKTPHNPESSEHHAGKDEHCYQFCGGEQEFIL